MSTTTLPVAVIGAGPVGLAAAAHLTERGLPFVVLEAGEAPAAAVRQWGHVRLFSPWRFTADAAARRLLAASGWVSPDPDELPTGAELVGRYLRPLAALPEIAPHVRLRARVVAISRLGVDRLRTRGRDDVPFVLRLDDGSEVIARAVVDASGTWRTPNVLGASGLPAHGEDAASPFIERGLPDVLGADVDRYLGRHTLVVGAGHSATGTVLALAELTEKDPATRVTWAIRGAEPGRSYGGGHADQLPARGALGTALREAVDSGRVTLLTRFPVHALAVDGARVTVVSRDAAGLEQRVTVDRVVAATGFRPDHSLTSELRLDLDPVLGASRALAPLIDPNEHSCGTVPPHGVGELTHPETGYYAVGMKSYGRAPTFLLATGHEQLRSVVAALAGDWDAARDVRLELPETGVCATGTGRGLATGIAGGLLTVPLQAVTVGRAAPAEPAGASSACCG